MSLGAIDEVEFAELMAAVGPFGTPPRLAVATSGGADSLALCLLSARWAQRRRGAVFALTIDHGLRPAAAAEAKAVGDWLKQRRVGHWILRWTGSKPVSAIQEAARDERYRLLSNWCRDRCVAHLLLGHHRDDQAETLIIRLTRGSGLDGLAAMPLVAERDGIRYVRPVLGIARERLAATLEKWGQPWIEDPSNRDPRFTRVKVRRQLHRGVLASAEIAGSARRIGVLRALHDDETSKFLAAAIELDPRGFCRLQLSAIKMGDPATVRRAISRVLSCVGVGAYPIRRARIERLVHEICAAGPFAARTLGGCRIVSHSQQLVVCRESGRIGPPVRLIPGRAVQWDHRYDVELSNKSPITALSVAAFARNHWFEREAEEKALARIGVAAEAIPTLPGVYQGTKLVAVPQLGLYDRRIIVNPRMLKVAFAPRRALAQARFWVA
ncbi:MAG: tRNA lysidine(34) synthetase TilS [Proteobacteria bacterium]|nr:tRNA lysidine(34) synthetase TilS [Pseudomonadota bacterium]